MKRRSGAGSQPPRPHKSASLKRRNAPKAARNRGASIAGQETVVARLTHERDEALLRETANAEILRLISQSPGDLEFVFRTILENATRICNANFGNLFRFDGEKLHPAAQFNTPAVLLEALTRRGPFKPTPGTSLDHVVRTKKVFHTADMAAEPVLGLATKLGGARSQVTVPMLKDVALIGVIIIYRQEVRPFTDEQIELVKNFAAQAVIAIENARLLNELRESLQQQTATSDVLSVISSSPGELEPVFRAVLQNAVQICQASFGNLWLRQGDKFQIVAIHGASKEYRDYLLAEPLVEPDAESAMGRIASTGKVVQIDDVSATPTYGMRMRIATIKIAKTRTLIGVPMLKDNEVIGIIAIYRQEVRPFIDRQIELLKNFAAQAVIAIENARLLNELRQRTTDLGEALEQQTATSEVLKVISSSPCGLEPVFEAILENATRICEAKFGVMQLMEGDGFRTVALHDVPSAYAEAMRHNPVFHPVVGHPLDRLAGTKQVVHIADVRTEQRMRGWMVELAGARTLLLVPMLKDNELVGVISIYRQEVRPFTDKQIELVQNFAAQAVIAIENTRLLNELKQSLDQQTATADVLGVISSSPGELEPVFQTMLENATRICEAKFGTLVPL